MSADVSSVHVSAHVSSDVNACVGAVVPHKRLKPPWKDFPCYGLHR